MKEEDIRKKEAFDEYLRLSKKDVETFFRDKSLFIEINCPACKSNELEKQFKKNGFLYMECTKCKTLFVNPRPGQDELARFYFDSPSTSYWINHFFKPVEKARTEKIFKPRAKETADLFRKDATDWTIGDIGAGFGIFLKELQRELPNNSYVAIEPSQEMCTICKERGFSTICNTLEDVKGLDNKFDLLTAFELFEHLQNPEDFLSCVHKLLKPKGFFLFTTLNGQGFDIKLLWNKSKSVSPPHHLNFFNTTSIKFLLESCGFEVIEISTPGKLDWDIVENMINKDGIYLGRFWEFITTTPETTKEGLQKWISSSNLSSHMRVICRRK